MRDVSRASHELCRNKSEKAELVELSNTKRDRSEAKRRVCYGFVTRQAKRG